jgi:anti-sigma regulatory factor (Ser/Thr protein kinase)
LARTSFDEVVAAVPVRGTSDRRPVAPVPARRASTALRVETTRHGPAFVLALGGRLGVAEAPAVRRALRKAATEPVDLVVCELSGLTWIHPACLALFVAAAPTLAWPAPPIWLAGTAGQVAEVVARTPAVSASVGLADAVDEAVRLARDKPIWPRALEYLPAHVTAPRRARRVAAEACVGWRVPEMLDTVQLVVSELVTNAVLRSRTEVELRLERRPDRLRVAVRDDAVMYNLRRHREVDQVVARGVAELEDSGRGLLLVKAMATSVGINRHPGGGKVTWAVIPIPPRPSEAAQPGTVASVEPRR